MQNKYQILKEKQQKEFSEFPIVFAFSKDQFKDSMKKLGLEEQDINQVVAISGGGFIKKTDVPKFEEILSKHKKELEDNIANDKTGEGFIKDMFLYELNNHEYSYTKNEEAILEALGISQYQLRNNYCLMKGLELAKNEIISEDKDKNIEEIEI